MVCIRVESNLVLEINGHENLQHSEKWQIFFVIFSTQNFYFLTLTCFLIVSYFSTFSASRDLNSCRGWVTEKSLTSHLRQELVAHESRWRRPTSAQSHCVELHSRDQHYWLSCLSHTALSWVLWTALPQSLLYLCSHVQMQLTTQLCQQTTSKL